MKMFKFASHCFGGNKSKHLKEDPPLMLTLPGLVTDNILDYLDLHNLKKLRIVSVTTKGWVEQPKYLEKFNVNMDYPGIHEQILYSTVPWSNFVFGKSEASEEVLKRFGRFIKYLKIHEFHEGILRHLSDNLETLIIDELECVAKESLENYKKWLINLVNVKIMQVEFLVVRCTPLELVVPGVFEMMLNACINLTRLELPLPVVKGDDGKRRALLDSEECHTLVLSPLLEYLSHNICLSILCWPSSHFTTILIETPTLFRILHMSPKTKIENIPSSALPQIQQLYTESDLRRIDNSVTSVLAFETLFREWGNRYKPERSKVTLEVQIGSEHDTLSAFNESIQPYSLHLLNCYPQPLPALTFQNFFGIVRNSVEEFKWRGYNKGIEEGDQMEPIFSFRHLTTTFPNLRKLELTCFYQTWVDFDNLFSQLSVLEHLSLLGIYDFTDDNILGDDYGNPRIMNLRCLTYLEIHQAYITSLSFSCAFKHMRLKTFKWKAVQMYHGVTFQDGISSLAKVEGGFKDSIETLEISKPIDCSRADIERFANGFKRLKKFKIYP